MQVTAPLLYCVAMNVAPLSLDMQNEPQLEAGVGHRRADAALAGFVDSSVYVGMLVAIEDAPYLVKVVCATISPCLTPSFPDQSHRGEAICVAKFEMHLVPPEGTEALPLCNLALSEYANDRALFLETGSCSPVFLGTHRHLRYVRVRRAG